ncbi:aldehyde dehydrogenase [Annulohypoxylon maeteangense]|uniref:aldehyde dehydrogenase n=1 Tax=Annulohypoxylon maeteangense TaxID=1927788 RepID=UPI0020073755|nr:aldehyde dehydrogenase [Annulohypoxylon maeteangense]KAI0882162.1 aldehyde dehydrogenase [Annulohypoxylon maeteangense]
MSMYTVPFVINGEERQAENTFDVKSPDTGEVLHRCGIATEADVVAAVNAAAAAGPQWANTPAAERRDILLKAANIMDKRRDELAQYMMDEVAAARGWADFNLNLVIDMYKDVAGRVGAVEGTVPPCQPGLTSIVVKEPYGVVLAIAPWNATYILGTRSVLFPIAAGNTVVFKGSETAPRAHRAIVSILNEAGVPKGVVNYIVTDPAHAPTVTEALVANPNVKKINFTGSTAVGRIITKLAGQYLKPIVLELGGKAPAIVWEDADLDLAAEQTALGAFFFSGQICMSTERIIVHKNISQAFQEKLLGTVEKMFSSKGDALVLVNTQSVEKNKKLIKDAVSKGASVLNGDVDAEESSKTRMRPLVISKVTSDMDLYKQESFGPSVSLIEVESEEEALRVANDTEYGLTSAVFTENLRVGLRFARGIESGAVHINNMTIHDEMTLPHGGVKASGYGRFNSLPGVEEWVRTKTITWRN